MNINKGTIAYLLIVWAFFIGLGLAALFNVPTILLLIATALYLLN